MGSAPSAHGGPPAVAHVLPCDGFGGTEMQVAGLLERLDPTRVQSLVLTLAPPGPVAERLSTSGIEVLSLGGSGAPRALVRLAIALRRLRPAVVNAYGFKASLASRVLVRLLLPRAAFVCGVRGETITETERQDDLKARLAIALERATAHLVDAYDANSEGALEHLAGAGIDRGRMVYIPNGIDLAAWPQRPPRMAGTPTVACVARLVARKHVGDLVHAASILTSSGVEARYVLAGDGPMLAELESDVHARGLQDIVRLPGRVTRSQVSELLAGADIFCLPSLWEGMAVAVMEAMASGLPVVGTDVNGIRQLVDHGSTGLLVPAGDPEALAHALAELIADEPRRRRMGEAGRARIGREFGMDRLVEAKTELYLTLAGSR